MTRARVGAALVALLVVGGIAGYRWARSDDHPTSTGPAAAERFVTAWEAKLRGTYVVDSRLSRSTSTGSGLDQTSRLVQRPPDRLLVGLGAVDGRVAGKIIRCGTNPAGEQSCGPTADAPAYDDEVAHELATIRSYVSGDRPLYNVVDFGDGCFRLDLALQLPAPPYGEQALFCFDAATGAPRLTVVRHGDVTERTEASAISGTVTGADLQIPGDRGSAVVVPPVPTAPAASSGG